MNGNPHHCVICDKPAIVDGEVQFDTILVGEVDGVFQYSCEDCDERRQRAIDLGMPNVPTFHWTRECELAVEPNPSRLTDDEAAFLLGVLSRRVDPVTLTGREQALRERLIALLDESLPY